MNPGNPPISGVARQIERTRWGHMFALVSRIAIDATTTGRATSIDSSFKVSIWYLSPIGKSEPISSLRRAPSNSGSFLGFFPI